MRRLELILAAMKPKRWWRALVIFLPLLFYASIFNLIFMLKLATAFIIFSLLTGAISLIGDIRDKEKDKNDPQKRARPLASGEISISQAEFALAMILTGSFVAAFFLGPLVGACAIAYFIAELVYFFFLKNHAVLDALNIALEMCLLLLAGILAGGKAISPWLIIFIVSFSMFFFYCEKMRAFSTSGADHAKNYGRDSLPYFINIFACFSMVIYTFYSIIAPPENVANIVWTVPFLVYCVCRTIILTSGKENNDNLEALFLKDRSSWVNMALWAFCLAALGFFK